MKLSLAKQLSENEKRPIVIYAELIQLNKVSEFEHIIEMGGPVAPNPANPGNNTNANANASQNNDNDNNDNNTPAGPNAPPPSSTTTCSQSTGSKSNCRSTCSSTTPTQSACTKSTCPTNAASPTPPAHPNPQQPAPANSAGPLTPVPNLLQPFPYQPAPQIIHQQMINQCHFKPEFAGKPEEDAEAHLHRSNDWIRTHNFDEDVKVQRFCLTLLGEARL